MFVKNTKVMFWEKWTIYVKYTIQQGDDFKGLNFLIFLSFELTAVTIILNILSTEAWAE